jgi:hypothetical protein
MAARQSRFRTRGEAPPQGPYSVLRGFKRRQRPAHLVTTASRATWVSLPMSIPAGFAHIRRSRFRGWVVGENTAPEQLHSAKTFSTRLWPLTSRSLLNLCLPSLERSRSAAGRNLKVSFPSQGSFSSLIPQLRCNQQTGADSRFIECEGER